MRTRALTLIVVAFAASCTRSIRVAQPGSPMMRTHAVVPRPESIEIGLGSPPFYVTAQTAIEVSGDVCGVSTSCVQAATNVCNDHSTACVVANTACAIKSSTADY